MKSSLQYQESIQPTQEIDTDQEQIQEQPPPAISQISSSSLALTTQQREENSTD